MRLISHLILIIVFIGLNTNLLFCQENNEVYSADRMYSVILDDDGQVAYKEEEGSRVMIIKDILTKKYTIYFYDTNNEYSYFYYNFVMYEKDGSMKMIDKNYNTAYIFDRIQSNHIFIMVIKTDVVLPKLNIKDGIMMFTVEDVHISSD